MIRIGSHVERSAITEGALERGAEVVQVNLSAPQTWASPKEKGDETDLKEGRLPIWVHAPYLLNPSSINPDILRKSKESLMVQSKIAARIGARGLVVHGGHPTGGGDINNAVENWLRVLDGWIPETLICIENTAGGKSAAARTLDSLFKLFTRIKEEGFNCGFVLDTCHAFAGGLPLDNTVKSVMSATGRIDLVHLNDSKDSYGSSRDRHENLGKGTIDRDWLVDVVVESDCDTIVETPNGAQAQKEDILWIRNKIQKRGTVDERV
ncbi:MAG: deoxyribonuclease IV [Candidatus Paceibacterota bacterium]